MNPKTLLERHQIDPKKSLGQNFLHDPNLLDKIVASAEISPGDTVLEIGPGTGALTERLAQIAARVIAVELDERLRPILEERLQTFDNVGVIYEDILTVNVAEVIGDTSYIVVANVPYYITSAILKLLLEDSPRPRRIVLTVQQEVAERVIAKPGDMSLLAVSVQFFGKPRLVSRINPAAFWPRPDVDSAILRIDIYDQPAVNVPSEKAFFRVVRAGFSQKRKQLKNAISSGLSISNTNAVALIERADIDPQRRAETLTLEEWASLARAVQPSP
jgi:16S rRNA (adenine1518-N6/adenine1519-N6)-dimethyltransferase